MPRCEFAALWADVHFCTNCKIGSLTQQTQTMKSVSNPNIKVTDKVPLSAVASRTADEVEGIIMSLAPKVELALSKLAKVQLPRKEWRGLDGCAMRAQYKLLTKLNAILRPQDYDKKIHPSDDELVGITGR